MSPSQTVFLVQVYVEDGAFVEALCKATTIQNRTVPIAVHVTVSTGAVSALPSFALESAALAMSMRSQTSTAPS